jgi:hypothetical protein
MATEISVLWPGSSSLTQNNKPMYVNMCSLNKCGWLKHSQGDRNAFDWYFKTVNVEGLFTQYMLLCHTVYVVRGQCSRMTRHDAVIKQKIEYSNFSVVVSGSTSTSMSCRLSLSSLWSWIGMIPIGKLQWFYKLVKLFGAGLFLCLRSTKETKKIGKIINVPN